MNDSVKNCIVFNSWQSDSPAKTNRYAIRSALRPAFSKLEEENMDSNLQIILDDATRGECGSPDISTTILEKIRLADIFVCDITTIYPMAETIKKTPNPNVLIELGFAIAHLGWGRIVMLFNSEYGTFPEDIPFDIRHHRIAKYKFKETDNSKKPKDELAELLYEAIKAIYTKNPIRPMDEGLSIDQIQRQRDVKQLKRVMESIHLPTLDQFVDDLPGYMYGENFHFWEGFNGIVLASNFHLYDKTAFQLIKEIHESWGECLSQGAHYRTSSNYNMHFSSNIGDQQFDKKQQSAWDKIEQARRQLYNSVKDLLNVIREKYIEIELTETNRIAWQEYIDFNKEQDQRMGK